MLCSEENSAGEWGKNEAGEEEEGDREYGVPGKAVSAGVRGDKIGDFQLPSKLVLDCMVSHGAGWGELE